MSPAPDIRHRFLQQAAVTLLPYHAHTALTTPEEEVKHQPHDGKEHQYQYPCHGFHRIAVVEDNDDNRSDDGTEINNVEGYRSNLAGNEVPIKHVHRQLSVKQM